MSNVAIMEPGEPERRNNNALTPLAMLNRAMETGASMEVLEKFMSLHERWEAGNARKAIATLGDAAPVSALGYAVRTGALMQQGAGAEAGKVWINDAQYFDAVPQAVWDMHIGGYRVAEKWLKDRRGRLLTYDDITHYQNVVAALARTLAIQTELDDAVDAAGGWPLQ